MEKFFHPQSVVVFGVSPSPTNLARNIIGNLHRFGFHGAVFAVGKDGGEFEGVKIHASVEDVPGIPELAVILLPARHVPEVIEACGRKGIRHAIIESGGFSEYAAQGQDLEKEVLETARRWGMRIVGPNCISIVNLENGLVLPFVPLEDREINKGNISIVAQSGGIALDCMRLLSYENLGANKLISMGNKLDVNENDFLEYLKNDDATRAIGFYLENIADGRGLMRLAGSTDKPLVVLKANTNPASNSAARFHTAALAGDDEVVTAALRQAGIHRVQNLREMMDCFKVFSLPVIKGRRLAVLGRSGGQAVLLADAVHRYGFQLAELSDDFFSHVRQHVRAGVIRMSNPLDMGDIFDIDAYAGIVEKALSEDGVDGVVFSHAYVATFEVGPSRRLLEASIALSHRYGKPVIPCIIPEKHTWFSMKEEARAFLFDDVDEALKALERSLWHHEVHSCKKTQPPSTVAKAKKKLSVLNGGFMKPSEAFALLASYGIPTAAVAAVNGADEAAKAAKRFRYPVALKTAAPGVLHKTEAGGVVLNIASEKELRKAFRAMKTPNHIVQKMAPAGAEVIIGARKDNEFGHVVLFGLGGIFVELLRDAAMRVVPVTVRDAETMVLEIKGSGLLKGFRGKGPLDVKALSQCIARVSKLLVDHPEIRNIDINPLVLYNKGNGCIAVDAKIEVE
ncbi:MAG TPA: acetate--CoA ligase family protein [Syntrophales bacterium]|nr:acetate--CoA ligase family protein [Syntrophales bacterium]